MQEFRPERGFDADPSGATDDDWVVRRACAHGLEDGMSIYVDEFPAGWGRWTGGGHMLTTDIDELHALAARIGLKREWFQDKTFPHYDVMRSKRRQALALGAKPVEFGELPDDVLMRCKDGTYERRCDRMARRKAEKRRMTTEARMIDPIRGQWTVTVCREHGERVGRGDQGEMLCPRGHRAHEADYVEVVPVPDEQAIERAAQALEDWNWRSGSLTITSRMLVDAVLAVALNTELPKAQHGQEDTNAEVPQDT